MSEKKEGFQIKIIDMLKSFRVWILIFFLFMSYVAIDYSGSSSGGVVINGVTPASPAENSGLLFDAQINPKDFEEIHSINNKLVKSVEDFYALLSNVEENSTVILRTDKNPSGYKIEIPVLNNQTEVSDVIGFSVREAPSSNIRLGIELEGGSRLILKPEQDLSDEDFDLLVDTLQSRLDVYGASGTKVNKIEDAFSEDKFVIVESISSNKNDIYELISRQGEFEARIGNKTVFTGDNVVQVHNDPQNARLEGCSPSSGGTICTFSFVIDIDGEGTDQFFDVSKDLDVIGGQLSEEITFILDGKNITSLSISSAFKYNKISSPQISVSGNVASTQDAAIRSAQQEMKFLQTILKTQSLPSELEVVQSYSITSTLGEKLLDNAVLVGLISLIIVASVVAIRYRHPAIFILIFLALIAEIIIVFGAAAFLRLSIDLVAIGGLIAAIGTGVDDQIIITDEYFRKRKKRLSSRNKIKAALAIILIAYLTTLAAMVPLYFAGLSLVKGFAFMIIVGVTVGVFITRPAYAACLRILMTSRKKRLEEEQEEE